MTTIKAGARLPGRIHGIWLLSGRRREDGGRKNWRKEGRRGGGSGSSAAAQCRVHSLRCYPRGSWAFARSVDGSRGVHGRAPARQKAATAQVASSAGNASPDPDGSGEIRGGWMAAGPRRRGGWPARRIAEGVRARFGLALGHGRFLEHIEGERCVGGEDDPGRRRKEKRENERCRSGALRARG